MSQVEALAFYFPFVHGIGTARGSPTPAGQRGIIVLNPSGEVTRTGNLSGCPGRLASLQMHDSTAGQSSPRLPEALGPGEQAPVLSHRLTHLEASVWAAGRAGAGRPRGRSTPGSPRPCKVVPSQTCLASSFLQITPLLLCGGRLHCQAGMPLFGQQASRTGLSPAFYMTAGPVPCACLVTSHHGGFSGSRPALNTAGVAFAAQLLPSHSVEVLGRPHGAEWRGHRPSFENRHLPKSCP